MIESADERLHDINSNRIIMEKCTISFFIEKFGPRPAISLRAIKETGQTVSCHER
jgi:hypothetical protein